MAALRNLFGKDAKLDKLPAELKPLVQEMRLERTAYEAAVKRAEDLSTTMAPLLEQVARVEQRLAGLDKLASQLGELRQGAAVLEEGQRGTQARVAETKSLADSARTALEGMRTQLAEVIASKDELPAILEQLKALGKVRSEASAVEARVNDLAGTFEKVRGQHEKIASEGGAALTRLAGLEQNLQKATARVESFAGRAEGLEKVVEQLQQLLKEVPDAKHELSTLNVLAEYVSRKVSTLESQRDLVDRATQRAERLTELTTQVDRQLQEQHENMKFLERLEKNVEEIKKLHESALDRAAEIDKKHRAIETDGRKLSDEFTAQRDALQKAADRFKFERDGLEALSQRITELRDAVGGVEKRFPALEQARSGLDAVKADAHRLSETTGTLAKEIRELESTAVAAQSAQTLVREFLGSVAELTSRMDALAPARLSRELDERAAQIEQMRSRVAGLERKMVDWDTLEERTERSLDLARERQAVVAVLTTDLQRVFQVADSTLVQVRTVIELQQQIDHRKQALDPILAKLHTLDTQAETLEARRGQFTEAEERLTRLDALLIDLKSTFDNVLGHKEFLERVVETAGNLALQTMQAEAAINTLREAANDVPKGRQSRSS